MLQEQRFKEILDIINEKHYVQVDDLAKLFHVSTMTIRRDLGLLCKTGKIERCHGGARSIQKIVQEYEYTQKVDQNHEEKVQLARVALSMIKPEDVVYLDSGTTTSEIAKLITKHVPSVIVVTNDLNIASILADARVSVTIVGGEISPMTKSAIGRASESFISQFRFSKAFLGTSCIDRNFDTFSPNYDKAYLKKLAIELSEKSYLVVDQSKFYGISMSYVTSLNQYTGVITNKEFNDEELAQIHKKGITIISRESIAEKHSLREIVI